MDAGYGKPVGFAFRYDEKEKLLKQKTRLMKGEGARNCQRTA